MPDQAPQTLDELIDTYKNDLATAKRLRDYGMEIETDGRLKLALTALIERVIGAPLPDGVDATCAKLLTDDQRKRLGELL